MTSVVHYSGDFKSDLNSNSGALGTSYGASIPVKPLILPARASLYNPLGSLFSAISNGQLTNTSINLPF